ncbi:hypothetical protein RR48_01200 [Papilio machaon]|uniref:Uncharacterized protein n=1 Tax=Papilio machaon TaxID=76193 RepID=A0A0N0PE13_PAPMA|nr:hypothetical protein RR48_01200 [Papilio machaon]
MTTKLDLTYVSFGNNPWQCACLREFLREVKQLNIAYDTDYFDGSSPVCVTTDEFVCMRDESVNDLFINMYRDIKS